MDEFYGATLSSSDTVLTNLSCVTDVDSTEFKYRIVDASKTNGWFDVDPDDVRSRPQNMNTTAHYLLYI